MTVNELFPRLVRVVSEAHMKSGLIAFGHDFDHDLRVASYALAIAPDSRTASLAAAAGLCHSVDHMISRSPRAFPSLDEEAVVCEWLAATNLDLNEVREVAHAVVTHEASNQDSDTLVQVTLKDADRLANLDADVIIRSGQFHPQIPAVDPVHLEKDPKANYQDPGSVLWDIHNCISWTGDVGPYTLRLQKAKELGLKRAAFLRQFIQVIRDQRTEIGLVPYPPIEV